MNAKKIYSDRKSLFAGIVTTAAVVFTVFALTTSSFAASSGKILKDGTRVRQDASTNSEIVVSLAKDDSITINGQLTGADGNIWYQITTSSGANGYVRSDLASSPFSAMVASPMTVSYLYLVLKSKTRSPSGSR